jgi:hypothetical protein
VEVVLAGSCVAASIIIEAIQNRFMVFLLRLGKRKRERKNYNGREEFLGASGMDTAPSDEITQLLKAWSGGDHDALNHLIPRVYGELRRMARWRLRGERGGYSLQTTALVHEVYIRLVDVTSVDWQDRAHFFAIAAQMMRRILVDAARARLATKRGGGVERADLSLQNIPKALQ